MEVFLVKAELELIRFDISDIVTTSGGVICEIPDLPPEDGGDGSDGCTTVA